MKSLIILLAYVATAQACSCAPYPSLERAFCAMDFVSYVRVLGKYSDGVGEFGNGFVNYQVEHLYIYRKPQLLDELPEDIKTPAASAACGVSLMVGEQYLLGGRVDKDGNLSISLCGLKREWNALQPNEIEALTTYTCDEQE